MITFIVPGRPLPQNEAYRIAQPNKRNGMKRATLLITEAAKAYKLQIASAAARSGLVDGPVIVRLGFYFDSERPDIDGPIKLALDGLQGVALKRGAPRVGGCLGNDRQVRRLVVDRYVDTARPRTEIQVEVLR